MAEPSSASTPTVGARYGRAHCDPLCTPEFHARFCPNGPGYVFVQCRRRACSGPAKAQGGYCAPCFERRMTEPYPRPEVVVLCGSTRFRADFERETRRLGMEGKIVLTVSMFGHDGDLPPEACVDGHPTKTALDNLHKRKIDMADRVLVINPGGYIGTSTRSEIDYAEWYEKPIDYLVPEGARPETEARGG